VTITTGLAIFDAAGRVAMSAKCRRRSSGTSLENPPECSVRDSYPSRPPPFTDVFFLPIPSAMATRSLYRVAPSLLKARSQALSSKASRAAFLAARGYASEAGHTVSPFRPNKVTF